MLALPNTTDETIAAILLAKLKAWGIRGKCSFFGGPNDDDRGNLEHQALALQFENPEGGKFRALDLDIHSPYCAMRWEEFAVMKRNPEMKTYTPALVKEHRVLVFANGRVEATIPVDHGPARDTGKLIDLSPGIGKALGLRTGDEVGLLLFHVKRQDVVGFEPLSAADPFYTYYGLED